MSYVKNSKPVSTPASKPSYNKPASPSKPSGDKIMPTHNLAVRCGEGDNVQFVDLTGLFPGSTKDGRALLKGKPKFEIIVRMEGGVELKAEQFLITAKN